VCHNNLLKGVLVVSQQAAMTLESSADDHVVPDYIQEPNGIIDASLLEFEKRLQQDSSIGSLGVKESGLLRKTMTTLATNNNSINNNDNSRGGETTPIAVEDHFYRMLDEWEAAVKSNDDDDDNSGEKELLLQPTTGDFLLVMRQWETPPGTKPLPYSMEHIWDLFRCMEDLCSKGGVVTAAGVFVFKPNVDIFNTVLRVLSVSRTKGADFKAREVFDKMKTKYGVPPTAETYHYLIVALAKSRDRGAASRAESLLREAAEVFPPGLDTTGSTPIGVKIDSFNVVLTAWAKSSLDYGPERAEKLIFYMDELDRAHGGHGIVRPNVSSFTSLIDAYVQELEWDSVSQAERIFNRLLDEYLEGNLDEPNVATWTIVLGAWAKLSRKKNRGAAPRADRLMRRMESLYKEGRISFGPDAIVYISTMNAWAFAKTIEGTEKSQEILLEMYDRYLDGDDSMKPTAKSIRVVLESWINSEAKDAMERAELLLDKLEDHLGSLGGGEGEGIPEEVSEVYKVMMFGWTRHGDPQRAQEYLMDMVDMNMHLDSFCFDRVIEANTQHNDKGAMDRTLQAFEVMEQCRRKGLVKPNERVFTSFMRAMIKARVPNVAHKSHVLIKRMYQLDEMGDNKGIRPTSFTYNAVLRACAETVDANDEDRMDAFKIAVQSFNELRSLPSCKEKEQQGPDHVSFGNMLRCAALIPNGVPKDSFIRSTFQLCCQSGFVNEFVIRDLQLVASEVLWQEMMHCDPETTEVNIETLPVSWRYKAQIKQQRKKDVSTEVRGSRR
jgi:hypothetical protein